MAISISHPLIFNLQAGLQKILDIFYLALSLKDRCISSIKHTSDLTITSPHCINIGGGPHFYKKGWLNLEEVQSILNPHPFKLTSDCKFPVKDESIETVYSSHCLEHLDTPTVQRILNEARRVMMGKGRLIIKLPDYEVILERWKQGDLSYFDENWALDSAVCTWKNRGVRDCLDFKAAMIFCGFWNEDYGNPYSGKINKNGFAYHGPPVPSVIGEQFVHSLLASKTPQQISEALRRVVLDNESGFTFNHQNAWSRKEFRTLLCESGYKVISEDANMITSRNTFIPGIKKMRNISMYFQAEKKEAR